VLWRGESLTKMGVDEKVQKSLLNSRARFDAYRMRGRPLAGESCLFAFPMQYAERLGADTGNA